VLLSSVVYRAHAIPVGSVRVLVVRPQWPSLASMKLKLAAFVGLEDDPLAVGRPRSGQRVGVAAVEVGKRAQARAV
jgi:hypothetical protein